MPVHYTCYDKMYKIVVNILKEYIELYVLDWRTCTGEHVYEYIQEEEEEEEEEEVEVVVEENSTDQQYSPCFVTPIVSHCRTTNNSHDAIAIFFCIV